MSDGDRILLLLASKPFLYAWGFEILRRTLPSLDRPSGWRSAWAGITRAVAGLVFGIPAFMLLAPLGAAGLHAGFFLVRVLLWAGAGGLLFPTLTWKRGLVFGAAGAVLNTILDFTIVGGPLTSLRLSC